VGAVLVGVGVLLAVSGSARAADCALADFAYNGACGPEFESPAWGDTPGWTDPSKYSTIKLADITGNGTDELIARNDDGLEIWTFDTTVGQWRPAIGADGLPEVLKEFHSPMPTEDVRGSWRDPAAFSTIQTADLYGDGAQEIIADHEPSGTRIWRYTPPAGTKSINGGSWSQVSTTPNVLPSPPAPAQYLSLHAVNANGGAAALTDQNASWTFGDDGFHSTGMSTLAPFSSDPEYYLDNMSGRMPELQGSSSVLVPANVYRTPNGVAVQRLTSGGSWVQLGPPPTSGFDCQRINYCSPLTDTASPSCSTPPNCFGSDPAYYETMRVVNNLLGSGDTAGYVLGRQRDGLHVFALQPYQSPVYGGTYLGWNSFFPVLTALADPSNSVAPQSEWSSIRTGDITGDGHTDVIALVGGQLRAWELVSNASGQLAWSELPANPALNLGSMSQGNAAYYSTIQVGPVAGPAYPDAVIARGPFGIRTWFYNLHGSGGWTSWLPQDTSSYPQFTGGQLIAWSRLNTLAQGQIPPGGTTVRDVWTGATAPTASSLTNLENGILAFAGCTGTPGANPPSYPSCAVPPNSGGFTGADWTAVVNETLAEIYDAGEAIDFFGQLSKLNGDTFLAEGNELPALADAVGALDEAAGGNSTDINPQSIWSAGLGIAGSIAGVLQPELGAVEGIASYLAGIIPSATPEVNGPSFTGTVADLQNKLATAVSSATKAVDVQSSEVLQSYGMLRLVAQLHGPRGPWNVVNPIGLSGSMQEGFVLWAYKQLLPTVLERDVVSNCDSNGGTDPNTGDSVVCDASPSLAATGGPPGPFAYLDSPHTVGQPVTNSWPCWGFATFVCHYEHPPSTELATDVWGTPADTCIFNGTPETEWTYSCNLGVKPLLSTDAVGGPANGWDFTTCTATPLLYDPGVVNGRAGSCSNWTSAQATTGAKGSMTLTAAVGLPRRFHPRSATLSDRQLLYEPRGRGKLLTRRSGRALGTIRLTVARGKLGATSGGSVLGSAPGQPPITLTLHHPRDRHARLTLSMSGVGVAVPHACQQLRASISLTTAPFTLETSLALSDGHRTQTVSLPAQWTCARNHAGAVTGLRTVRPPAAAQHPGLALSVTAPHTVIAGSIATYTIRLHNARKRSRNRDIASLWHILVYASLVPATNRKHIAIRVPDPMLRRLAELRHGKTHALRIHIQIPDGLRQASINRVCLAAGAIADSARPAGARACSAIRPLPSAVGPPPHGLG
jgi:hypothetical protein